MERTGGLFKRLSNALTNKGQYSLPPEIFDRSRSTLGFKIFNTFMDYSIDGKATSMKFMCAFKENPLVYMVVNKISTTTSNIKQIAVDPLNKENVIENSLLIEFLNTPNLYQTEQEFRQSIYEALALAGNVFLYRSDTVGLENDFTVDVWNPGQVEILCNDNGEIIGYKYQNSFNKTITVSADELDKVLHIRTSNIAQYEKGNAYLGISPLEALWIVVKSSQEKFNAEASIFKNRGIIGILTNNSDIPMLPTDRERMQKEFDNEIGGADQYNKIKISNTKLNYIQTGMTPTDLKLLEGIVSSLRQICAAYGLPSVLFNDNDNSTYNNVREAKVTAYQDVYLPMCETVNDKLSPWLSKNLGVKEYLIPDLTRIDVLRNTTNKIMTALNSLDPGVARTLVAALRINDVLELLGAEPMAQGGEELLGTGTQTATNENI